MNTKTLVTLLLFPIALTVVPISASAQSVDGESGVKAAIELYLKGQSTGDAAYHRAAFLPTARIEGNRDGKFVSWTLDEYCAFFKGAPAADEAIRKRRIDSIDIVGEAAMVKATLIHGAITFTDYFVLVKVDGAWKIANKVYNAKR